MTKEVLVVGKGGREHVFGLALRRSPDVRLYTAPGNAGTAEIGENLPIDDSDIPHLAEFATQRRLHLTVVGPEGPLSKGIVDEFRGRNLPIFGPTQEAAERAYAKIATPKEMESGRIPRGKIGFWGAHYRTDIGQRGKSRY